MRVNADYVSQQEFLREDVIRVRKLSNYLVKVALELLPERERNA